MSKRNFILLIISLAIILIVVFGFLYFQKPTSGNPDTGGTNFGFDFNPFGGSKIKTPTDGNTPTDVSGYITPTPEGEKPVSKLKKISSMPIAGYGVFMKERFKEIPAIVAPPVDSTTAGTVETTPTKTTPTKVTAPLTEFMPALRYVARATGNIYQTFADKIEERKFSTTIIPKVHEAYFGNKAESVIMRYLKIDDKTIDTFVGSLPKEYLGSDTAGDNELKGSFLPENIEDVSVSPDTSSIFYLLKVRDGSVGVTAGTLGDKKSQVFDSPFTEWLSSWPSSKMITINTKPSGNVPGYVYAIDPSRKDLTKILGGINGLTTLVSPNGKLMLYSNNNLSLSVYHIDTREVDQIGINTLSEKCVWGKISDTLYCSVPKYIDQALYPDSWYKGETSFSDEIWKVDLVTGNATKIVDPISLPGGEDIDGTKLALDDAENYLFFVNKKDSYLWKLDLK